jgi:hypothetical protein
MPDSTSPAPSTASNDSSPVDSWPTDTSTDQPSLAAPPPLLHRSDVYSPLPVIPGFEPEDEWHFHRSAVLEQLAVAGTLELELANHAALLTWRLRRLSRFRLQPASLNTDTDASPHAVDGPDALSGAPSAAERALDRELARLCRYETHLTRQLELTLDRIANLQKIRRRQEDDAPARRGPRPRTYAPVHASYPNYYPTFNESDWADSPSPKAGRHGTAP